MKIEKIANAVSVQLPRFPNSVLIRGYSSCRKRAVLATLADSYSATYAEIRDLQPYSPNAICIQTKNAFIF